MSQTVFISYSHDSKEHMSWVRQLGTRLRSNGIDAVLDQWNLTLGQNLAFFMEAGLSESKRVLCICSDDYIAKANSGKGGVGYEKQIIASEFLTDTNTDWVVPILRNNKADKKLPNFLSGRIYVDFDQENRHESHYEKLLRELLHEPLIPVPPLGTNPFQTAKFLAEQKFFPNSEKYVSPDFSGTITFDYSNNNGRYSIGLGALMFETEWSKSSDRNIVLYNDPPSMLTVAIAKGAEEIESIVDARAYDDSSRTRRPQLGQIVVLKNANGFHAALKILSIKDDTRGSEYDEITFEYVIQTNGTSSFQKV